MDILYSISTSAYLWPERNIFPYIFTFTVINSDELNAIHEWCSNIDYSAYIITNNYISFKNSSDAALFKLMFYEAI